MFIFYSDPARCIYTHTLLGHQISLSVEIDRYTTTCIEGYRFCLAAPILTGPEKKKISLSYFSDFSSHRLCIYARVCVLEPPIHTLSLKAFTVLLLLLLS